MARFNEILTGRFNRFAQKFLSMKGPASLVTLSDEAFAVFDLNGARPEDLYLLGFDTFAATLTAGPSTGNIAGVRIRNPVGSNVIATITKAVTTETTSDQPALQFGPTNTDLGGTTIKGTSLDTRGRANSTLSVSQASPAAGLSIGIALAFVAANVVVDFIQNAPGIPLLPGSGLQIQGNVVNQQIVATFWWYERLLEESERA